MIVQIEFDRLKGICMLGDDSSTYCNNQLKPCTPDNCPLIDRSTEDDLK